MYNKSDYIYEYGGVAKSNHRFFRNHFEINDYQLVKTVCDNIDFFQSIYGYENGDIVNGKIIGPLCFDLDGDLENDEQYEMIKSCAYEVVMTLERTLGLTDQDIDIYYSGSKGFHIIVNPEVLGIEPCMHLNELYKLIATWFVERKGINLIDPRIYDRRRLLRVPSSINSKTMRYKIRLTIDELLNLPRKSIENKAKNPLCFLQVPRTHELNELAAQRFLDFALRLWNESEDKKSNHHEPEAKSSVYNNKKLMPCIRALLNNRNIQEGQRNTAIFTIANSLSHHGYSEEDVIEILTDWNSWLENPYKERDVIDPIRCVYRRMREGNPYKEPGCALMKNNGFCVGSECKYYKN